MRLRKALDRYYDRGVSDGSAGRPPDPFLVSSRPRIQHRDHRHFRRAYDAGWHFGHRNVVGTIPAVLPATK